MTSKASRTGAIRDYDLPSAGVKAAIVVIYVSCAVLTIVSLFPPIWVFLASFKDIKEFTTEPTLFPKTFDFSRLAATWNNFGFGRYYLNSLLSVAGSVVCAVVVNGLLAYGITILKPKGAKVVYWLILWSMLIPATTSIVPLFVNINNLGLSGFFTPLWLAAGANAFFVILFARFFESFPREMLEAGRIDGCTTLNEFARIVMPLSMPIVIVVVIYAINGAWSDFLLPYLVLNGTDWRTVMVRLFQFRTEKQITDVDVLRAVIFSIIPPTILFVAFQKKLTENLVLSGVKG
ncbi:ABC transporter [Clostridia bacterium]|nr:ABC transporter [Clostridia bacterium]